MASPFMALAVTTIGTAGSVWAVATDVPSNVAPYVGASSAAAAVAGLVYLARKMSNGQLVASDTKTMQDELVRIIEGQRKVIEEQREDKQQMRDLFNQNIELQRETNRIIGRWSNVIAESSK